MAQVNPGLVGVFLKCLFLTALVLVALFLVSFSALGMKFWLFVRSWVSVGGWGKFVFLGHPVNPNPIHQAWLGHFVGIADLFRYVGTHGICQFCCHSGRMLVLLGQIGLCTVRRPGERLHEVGCAYEWSYVDLHVKGNGQVHRGEEEGTDVDGICDVGLLP